LFAGFAVQLALGRKGGARAAVLLATVVLSTLWAIGTLTFELVGDALAWAAARVFDVARIGGWLAFLLLLGMPVASGGGATHAARNAAPPWLFVVAGILLLTGLALPMPAAVPMAAGAGEEPFLLAAGLGVSVLGLVIVEQLYRRTPAESRWGIKPLVLGLAGMFAFDLFLFSDAMLFRRLDPELWAARGFAHALVIPFVAVATARNTAWTIDLHVSRGVVLHSTALLVSGVYLLALAAAGYYVRFFGGSWGRMLQVALVFAALLVLALVVCSGRFRSRLRVFVSKHFFSYRFDYREEWLRFTRALTAPSPQLGVQDLCIKALADLVESSAGALWMRDGDAFRPAARWNLPELRETEPAGSSLTIFLGREWLIDLPECVATPERCAGLVLPVWLGSIREPWLIVPLMSGTDLIGFVVLAQPRAAMKVDWEVRDLLKTAGRQAASYLAQIRTTEQLLEARKFDAFNRMSAFVVHDLKNLVAQLSLLLRNAERHHGNPDFQRDALETVEHVTQRMNAIMKQLRTGTTPVDGPKPVELATVVRKIQRASSGRRIPITVEAAAEVRVLGHEDRVERVIGHLVQNALDATGDGGKVVVRVLRDGDSAIVEVADDGAGMTPEFVRDRLFRPFQTTKPQGMGIGLYESFQYVAGLGGRILVDSAPGAGTKVRVSVPYHEIGPADEESLREVA
jgi:putative PEP-CTERM system histidine kinase